MCTGFAVWLLLVLPLSNDLPPLAGLTAAALVLLLVAIPWAGARIERAVGSSGVPSPRDPSRSDERMTARGVG